MTSCNQISSEIAALRADIQALNDKFILKTDRQRIIDEARTLSIKYVQTNVEPELNALQFVIQGIIATIAFIKGAINNIPKPQDNSRIAQLERRVSLLEAFDSRLLSIIKGVKIRTEQAFETADLAFESSRQSFQLASESIRRANAAFSLADTANGTARTVKQLADTALQKIDFLDKSVRAALEGLQKRLLAEIFKLQNRVKKLEGDINIIERAIIQLYALVFQSLRNIDFLELKVDQKIFQFEQKDLDLQIQINKLRQLRQLPGRPGRDGKDGKNGRDGITTVITKVVNIPAKPILIPGTPGRPGRDGKDGKNGRDGKDLVMSPQMVNILNQINNKVNTLSKPLSYQETVAAAKQGVCEESQQDKCIDSAIKKFFQNTTITITTGTCTLNNETNQHSYQETEQQISVPEDQAEAIKKYFDELNKVNKTLCEEKNNVIDVVASVPLNFQIKPEWQRPQMILHFAAKKDDGKFDDAKYVITIPHWRGRKGQKLSLPDYRKGNFEVICTLGDNSKITVNAANESEGRKIINAILPFVDNKYRKDAIIRPCGEVSKSIKVQQVFPRYGRFFAKGAGQEKPDFRIDP